jgi:hypothetical protein
MTTLERADMNRDNARYSTGPKSAGGKKKSSLNALRHGMTSQIVVMPNEDLAVYQQHLNCFFDELQPVGVIEENLVQALADCSWRLNRVVALESKLLIILETSGGPDLKALASLSTHSQRLSRQFEKTEKHLRELQKIRRDQEQHDLDQFLDIREMYEDKGETYDHAEDGFVFSEDQIRHRIRARNRERRVEEAVEYWETAA